MRWIINNCCCASHLVCLSYHHGISNEKYHFKHCSHNRCSTKLISQVPAYFASSCLLMKLETSCSLFQPMRVWKKSASRKQLYLGKGFFWGFSLLLCMSKHCLSIMNCLRGKRYIVGGEMESLYQYMSLMHVNVFNYVPHMSHAV